jgi:hypothetical protein
MTTESRSALSCMKANQMAKVPNLRQSPAPMPKASYPTLPKVQQGSKPVIGPGLPSRINQPLGGTVTTYPVGMPPFGRPMSDRGGNC